MAAPSRTPAITGVDRRRRTRHRHRAIPASGNKSPSPTLPRRQGHRFDFTLPEKGRVGPSQMVRGAVASRIRPPPGARSQACAGCASLPATHRPLPFRGRLLKSPYAVPLPLLGPQGGRVLRESMNERSKRAQTRSKRGSNPGGHQSAPDAHRGAGMSSRTKRPRSCGALKSSAGPRGTIRVGLMCGWLK